MTRYEWNALAERCEKATGTDREIDATIAIALFGWQEVVEYIDPWGEVPMFINKDGDGPCIPERYTESLDAITSLIERELPEWGVTLGYEAVDFRPAHKPHAALWAPGVADEDGTEYSMTNGRGATLALALCAAFCRAMGSRAND